MPDCKLKPLAAAILIASIPTSQSIFAETKSTESLTIEEVVVTARNREESLSDVPISVSAYSSEQLSDLGINDVEDLINYTPGVSFDAGGSTATGSIVMRGLSQPGLIGDETNVAVFVDGVYQSGRAAAFMPFTGLERIEVVRGPQSALYGRNAFAGAINYITKKPSTDFTAGFESEYGNYDRERLSGFISGPVLPGFGMRFDAVKDDTGSTWEDEVDHFDLGQNKTNAQRFAISYTPFENTSIDLSVTNIEFEANPEAGFFVEHNALVPAVTSPISTGNPEEYIGNITEATPLGAAPGAIGDHMNSDRMHLTFESDFEAFTFTSISGYNKTEYESITGYDTFSTGALFVPSIPGVTDSAIAQFNENPAFADRITNFGAVYKIDATAKELGGQPNDNRKDISQEIRFTSASGSSLPWSAGFMYAKTELDQWLWNSPTDTPLGDPLSAFAVSFSGTGLDANSNPRVLQRSDYETKTKSAFFSVGYDATDKLSFTVEGRQTKEDKRAITLI
jgi:iron complex outermembrane receptor protein